MCRLVLAVLTLIALSAPAWAKKKDAAKEEAAVDAAAPAAPFRVMGFQDIQDSPDCDPVDARYGRCVEAVRFVDLPEDGGKNPDRAERALWKDIATLYARVWEGMAYTWHTKDAAVVKVLQAAGFTGLPSPGLEWDGIFPGKKTAFALPDRAAWLGRARWISDANNTDKPGFYRELRTIEEDGLAPMAPTVLMSGRFALRLGFGGKPHDYDLMDGDPKSSGPFFEQMYPYKSALESQDNALVPLTDFVAPDLSKLGSDPSQTTVPTRLATGEFPEFASLAEREFEQFYRLVSVQVAQFAMQDFTDNQVRVLTALTSLVAPPGALERKTGLTRDLVAAALGQTDTAADVAARTDKSVYSFQGGFALRYEQIPGDVVDVWLARLVAEDPPGPEVVAKAQQQLVAFLGDLVRDDRSPLVQLDEPGIRAWMVNNLRPGMEREDLVLDARRLVLGVMVGALPAGERDRVETWILLDHVTRAISGGMDQTPGKKSTAADLVAMATGQWKKTLGLHGYTTNYISQGLGAVDPTAICTTRDGVDALKEPSFGVIDLDLLVEGADGATDPTVVLWAARDHLPFVLVDAPQSSVPSLARLVGLPGGRALYRVRWHLWSGWHLLWSPETLPGGQTRLALRTSAICADTVLAPPEIVPTVVRAALLDGELRPTTPVRRADLRAWSKDGRDPVDVPLPKGQLPLDEVMAYLKGVALPPLHALSTESGGLLLTVFDATDPQALHRWVDYRPRVPYDEVVRHVQGDKRVQSASWTWFLPKDGTDPTMMAPAWAPLPSVATATPIPHWNRLQTVDLTAGGGLDAFPFREVLYNCSFQTTDLDVVAPCTTGGTLYGEGFGADGYMATTIWLTEHPRLAVETGIAVQLDLLHNGSSWFYTNDSDLSYAWSFRPQLGLMGGLRWAPRPSSLWRSSSQRWPWGADQPDGTSNLGRTQAGLRGAFLVGPGFNGIEATALAEGWLGWSVRATTGKNARFTPYQPRLIVGPFVRGAFGFPFPGGEGDTRYLTLDQSWTVSAGIRGQIRLGDKPPTVPQAPKAPKAPTMPGGS